MVFFLLLVLAAVALGIIGAVVKGLLYLLIIGVVIFLLSFIVLGVRMRRGRRRPLRCPPGLAARPRGCAWAGWRSPNWTRSAARGGPRSRFLLLFDGAGGRGEPRASAPKMMDRWPYPAGASGPL